MSIEKEAGEEVLPGLVHKAYYSVAEVATYLEVSERTVHRYLRDASLRSRKIGGRRRISRRALIKFVS